MERSNTFVKAMELVERILFTERSSLSNRNTTPARNTSENNEHQHQQQQSESIAMVQSMERHFKAPVCEPHYSFVYGNDAELITSLQQQPPPPSLSRNDSPRSATDSTSSSSSSNSTNDVVIGESSSSGKEIFVLECPPNFTCTEIAVVWTYPSCLEGVKQWREIGRFTLEEEKSKY